MSVVCEIKTKVILTANQKKEKYPLRANENSKSIHFKAFPSEPLVIYVQGRTTDELSRQPRFAHCKFFKSVASYV